MAKEKREKISAREEMESAPSGVQNLFLNTVKMPTRVKIWEPERRQVYRIAILPWKAGVSHPSVLSERIKKGSWVTNRFLKVHRNIGPDGMHVLCGHTSHSPCAVCEEFARLQKEQPKRGTPEAKDYWTDVLSPLKAKDREVRLIHVFDDKWSKNIYLWEDSTFAFGDSFRALAQKREAWLDYADFYEGCTIELSPKETAIGSGSFTDFREGIIIEERKEPLPDWLIKAASELCPDDWIRETPYKDVKEMLSGGLSNGGDEDKKGRRAPERDEVKPARSAVRKPAPVDDEPEPDDDEPEPDDDEPEPDDDEPEPDDDDEPEPDDDDEPEPDDEEPPQKPVKKPRRK